MSFEDISPFEDDCGRFSYFEKLGNGVAAQSVFTSSSLFYHKSCEDYSSDFYEKVVDYQKLITFLTSGNSIECFDWKDYVSYAEKTVTKQKGHGHLAYTEDEQVPVDTPYKEEVAIPYSTDNIPSLVLEKAFLNSKVCKVDKKDITYNATVDAITRLSEFNISIHYQGTFEKRNTIVSTVDGMKIDEGDKYKAIILQTPNPLTFQTTANKLLPKIKQAHRDFIIGKFDASYKALKDSSKKTDEQSISWFYSKIPAFAISIISLDNLWEDFLTLLEYNRGWFIDESSTLIKILQAFTNKENGAEYLYEQLYAEPSKIKDIFYDLDNKKTTDFLDTGIQGHRSIFVSLMTFITYEALIRKGKPIISDIPFFIGKDNRVDSNISIFYDTENKFSLQSEYRDKHSFHWETWSNFGPRRYLHPLELVKLTFYTDEGKVVHIVPSIVVKNIAQKEEWERVNARVRFAGNVLSIIGGIAALTTGNPFIIALAVADITVALIDIPAQLVEADFQSKEGQAFLTNWNIISTSVSIVTAVFSAPDAIISLLRSGGKLLIGAKNMLPQSREFLVEATQKVVLGLNKKLFPDKYFISAQIGLNAIAKNSHRGKLLALEPMEQAGVIFARLEDMNGTANFSAIYDGKVIVSSPSVNDFAAAFSNLFYKEAAALKKGLREMVRKATAFDQFIVKDITVGRIEEIVTHVRKATSMKNFSIQEISEAAIQENKLSLAKGAFINIETFHFEYNIPLKGNTIYMFNKIKNMDGKTLGRIIQHELYKIELTEYIKHKVSIFEVNNIYRIIPPYLYNTYILCELAKKTTGRTAIILSQLNTLNVWASNVKKILDETHTPMTLSDLKNWDIDEELKRLNIITE